MFGWRLASVARPSQPNNNAQIYCILTERNSIPLNNAFRSPRSPYCPFHYSLPSTLSAAVHNVGFGRGSGISLDDILTFETPLDALPRKRRRDFLSYHRVSRVLCARVFMCVCFCLLCSSRIAYFYVHSSRYAVPLLLLYHYGLSPTLVSVQVSIF